MALLFNNAKFLAVLYGEGAKFERTLTLGRMSWLVRSQHEQELRETLQQVGIPSDKIAALFSPKRDAFADDYFRLLGSETLDAIDYSDYEKASIIHDLNIPVPHELDNQYDLVFDGGCLEHVFNYPNALASCLRMARVGGRVVLHTPCNNAAGHGFYQFSPELFFRVFSPENGFVLERIIAHENFRGIEGNKWFSVRDPAELGMRVGLDAGHGIMLLVCGRKTADVTPFARPPLQSDYQKFWRDKISASEGGLGGEGGRDMGSFLESRLPRVMSTLRTVMNRPLHNPLFFTPEAAQCASVRRIAR